VRERAFERERRECIHIRVLCCSCMCVSVRVCVHVCIHLRVPCHIFASHRTLQVSIILLFFSLFLFFSLLLYLHLTVLCMSLLHPAFRRYFTTYIRNSMPKRILFKFFTTYIRNYHKSVPDMRNYHWSEIPKIQRNIVGLF
jgi:hypothetical protein